jgi:hypothetical protein
MTLNKETIMAINLRKTVNKDKLKAKFEAEASGGNQGPSDFLPYFKLKNKDSVVLRFLSDANPQNQDFFTYTEEVFNFNGKNMKFDGPSKDCPASKIASDLFAEAKSLGEETAEGKEVRDRALKFYKKRKYLANAYIVDAPEYFWIETGLDPDKIEDRVKVVSLPKKVYDGIKDTVMDDDFEDVEFYNFGDDVVNFKLTVKKNAGGYNDYSASKFEIKPKDLDVEDDDIDVIAESLKDLSTLFKAHTLDDFNEAIEIELNGDEEDEEEEAPKAKRATKKAAPVVEDDDEDDEDEDEEEEEAPAPKKRAAKKVVEEEPEDEDEDDEEEEEAPKKDIKNLRKGILSKLKIEEDA